jgi:hypothetical protein
LDGDAERSKAAFQLLYDKREQVEIMFGDKLDWNDLPGKIGCRISADLEGGWRTPDADWPAMQDKMIAMAVRLEKALKPNIEALKV